MNVNETWLIMSVDCSAEVDDEKLRDLFRQLQNEIQQIGAVADGTSFNMELSERVSTRGDPFSVETLIISLASAGVFTAIVETIRAWTMRGENRHVKMKVQVGEKAVELDYSPSAISQKELMDFTNLIIQALEKAKKSDSK